MHTIAIDGEILQWVLVPIVFILLLVGILRHFVTIALSKKAKPTSPKAVAEQQLVAYTRHLLANNTFLPLESAKARSDVLIKKMSEEVEFNGLASMMEGGMMAEMMKQNMIGVVPNIVMVTLISTFFNGFIIARFPFALSAKFKPMTQRGVDIDMLDGNYATSLSLYFLILFGLQGILQLILGSNEGDETRLMQQQINGPAQQAGQDPNKIHQALTEELKFSLDAHRYQLENAVALLLQGK